ncbi:MAG: hypothetical protein KC593_11020 [Myxococcales bacterium]|nr:hypothetical protein [Myxococcales bacterium]MCB9626321.1 hypothetical protein [Sandaracinaceae bacterium]
MTATDRRPRRAGASRLVAVVPVRVALSVALVAWVTLVAGPGAGQSTAQTVSLASLRVRGPVARAAVQRVMEASLDAYRRCHADRVAERGRLAGELHVRVHVEANGEPIAASVDWSNVGDRPLDRCVTQATEAWRLPESDAATLVSFTLRVGQGAPTGAERDVTAVIADEGREDAHLPESARNTQPTSGRARAQAVRRTWAPVDNGLRVVGPLSEGRVARTLRARSAPLRACVAVPHTGSGDPIPWPVLLSLQVGANGRVNQEPVVQVAGAPPGVLACIAAVLRETRFPTAAGETQVLARFQAVPRS